MTLSRPTARSRFATCSPSGWASATSSRWANTRSTVPRPRLAWIQGRRDRRPPDEFMRRLGTLPLIYQPGTSWLYNTAAEVLSVLVARASGQAFDVFLRERLFEPLGMSDTGFSVPAAKIDRLATSYMINPETHALQVYDEDEGGDWSRPPVFPNGAGGLVSTADDYLSFARMLMDGGKREGARIMSRPSVELMTTDQLTPEQKARSGFG